MASSAKINATMAKVAEREARRKAQAQTTKPTKQSAPKPKPAPKPAPKPPAPEVDPQLVAKAEAAGEEWGGKVSPPQPVKDASAMPYLIETFTFAKGGVLIQTGAEVVTGLARALTLAGRHRNGGGTVVSVNPWHVDPSLEVPEVDDDDDDQDDDDAKAPARAKAEARAKARTDPERVARKTRS